MKGVVGDPCFREFGVLNYISTELNVAELLSRSLFRIGCIRTFSFSNLVRYTLFRFIFASNLLVEMDFNMICKVLRWVLYTDCTENCKDAYQPNVVSFDQTMLEVIAI